MLKFGSTYDTASPQTRRGKSTRMNRLYTFIGGNTEILYDIRKRKEPSLFNPAVLL
ncbi:hypothetical protein P8X24_02595 [Pyrococcus kukulkanii]|uniref:hypothetical protein n=1 Tax=Pyrococcus kukulkanii TaxID=1609559 RepID=UPI003565EE71